MNPVPEERLERLEHAVAALDSRLAELEGRAAPSPAAATPESAPLAAAELVPPTAIAGLPTLTGRTLVVLGGAFAVRSLTQSGTLSAELGVALGVLYAGVWLYAADRAAGRGQTLSGAFHAVASALAVYPLLFEATTRLALLSPLPAALLLVAANAAGLAVAWRRGSVVLAWIQQVASLAVAVPLLFRTRAVLAFGLALLALAVGSLVLAYGRGWRGQRWLVAIGLDLAVAMLGALWLFGRTPPPWLGRDELVTLQLALAAIYLTAFVLRLLVQERRVTRFAVAQTVAVLLLGFEAALRIAAPPARTAIAASALALAAILHALLARRAEARVGHGAAVAYFASLATFLAAEAVRILWPAAASVVWLGAAVAVAALAMNGTRPILQAHAALLAAAGIALSGLLRAGIAALALPARSVWPDVSPAAIPQLALAAAVVMLLYRGARQAAPTRLAAAARLVATTALAVAAGGLVTRWLAGSVGVPGAAANAGHLATLRTVVLAAAAASVALAARRPARPELIRLAWTLLAVAGLKLIVEDLRQGSATDLLFSLAIYGVALIAVPALLRRRPAAPR
ncbi:MAG: hypothetical protein NDJ75_07845 [Thermoanaerobaculia bacterium]|nr:hypothetical protein [Thermoanaerobaculia bacterium]